MVAAGLQRDRAAAGDGDLSDRLHARSCRSCRSVVSWRPALAAAGVDTPTSASAATVAVGDREVDGRRGHRPVRRGPRRPDRERSARRRRAGRGPRSGGRGARGAGGSHRRSTRVSRIATARDFMGCLRVPGSIRPRRRRGRRRPVTAGRPAERAEARRDATWYGSRAVSQSQATFRPAGGPEVRGPDGSAGGRACERCPPCGTGSSSPRGRPARRRPRRRGGGRRLGRRVHLRRARDRRAWTLYDPWIVLAAMAMRTTRVRLGALVFAPTRRRPWLLATEAATLDRLSGGRLVLPVGLGALDDAGFGNVGEAVTARDRARLLDETLAIVEGPVDRRAVRVPGRALPLRADDASGPARSQRPRIPVWSWAPGRTSARCAAPLRWDGRRRAGAGRRTARQPAPGCCRGRATGFAGSGAPELRRPSVRRSSSMA